MAKSTTSLSDVQEQEYGQGIRFVLIGVGIALVASIFLWIASLVLREAYNGQKGHWPVTLLQAIAGIGYVGALGMAGLGAYRMFQPRKLGSIEVTCPYCDGVMKFVAEPTDGFDCEMCHRKVQYEDGAMVAVRTVTCAFCQTEHRISVKTTRYLCESCNRALRLTDANATEAVVAEQSDLLQNYDVLLTEIGRNRDDVAMALESILVCNLRDARRQMESLPLTVAHNVAERKADAIRRRLRDLGATAAVKPTAVGQQPPRTSKV